MQSPYGFFNYTNIWVDIGVAVFAVGFYGWRYYRRRKREIKVLQRLSEEETSQTITDIRPKVEEESDPTQSYNKRIQVIDRVKRD